MIPAAEEHDPPPAAVRGAARVPDYEVRIDDFSFESDPDWVSDLTLLKRGGGAGENTIRRRKDLKDEDDYYYYRRPLLSSSPDPRPPGTSPPSYGYQEQDVQPGDRARPSSIVGPNVPLESLPTEEETGEIELQRDESDEVHSPVTEDQVYRAALAIAYLVYLLQPKASGSSGGGGGGGDSLRPGQQRSSSFASEVSAADTTTKLKSPNRHSKGGFSISGLSEVFMSSGGSNQTKSSVTSSKVPKDLFKALKNRLEAIAKGKDVVQPANNTDQNLRAVAGIFYGKFSDSAWLKSIKENRKAEEIILHWTTVVQAVLKKRSAGTGDPWKDELDRLVNAFVNIMIQCLRSKEVGGTSPDLLARLERYTSKFGGRPPNEEVSGSPKYSTAIKIARRTSGIGTSDYSKIQTAESQYGLPSLSEMPMVKVIAKLFCLPATQVLKDLSEMHVNLSQRAALRDLKSLVDHVNLQMPFPGRPSDFATPEAYQYWRTAELKTLSQLMLSMVQLNPELARSVPGEALPKLLAANSFSSSPDPKRRSASGGLELPREDSNHSRTASGSPLGARPRYEDSRRSSRSSRLDLINSDQNHPEAFSEAVSLDNSQATGNGKGETTKLGQDWGFAFIPRSPKEVYTALLAVCIASDLASFANLGPDEEVSIRILSKNHIDLLNECGVRWRLRASFRAVAFVDSIREKFDEEHVPIECVIEGLNQIKRVYKNGAVYSLWPIEEQDALTWALLGLCMALIRIIADGVRDAQGGIPWQPFAPYLGLLDELIGATSKSPWPLVERPDLVRELDKDFESFQDALDYWSYQQFAKKLQSIIEDNEKHFSEAAPEKRTARDQAQLDLIVLLTLIDWIKNGVRKALKSHPDPILGRFNFSQITLKTHCTLFFAELERLLPQIQNLLAKAPKEVTEETSSSDVWLLLQEIRELRQIHQDVCPNIPLTGLNVELWFLPQLEAWLERTSTKTQEWVLSAIRADTFVKIDDDTRHSTSVVDLFSSFSQAHTFITELRWPDEVQNARFITALAKAFSAALEEYIRTIGDLFNDETFQVGQEPIQQKQSAWLAKARQTIQEIQGERRIEPFHFSPASCVKLNNVEAAKHLLDTLYGAMDADKVSAIVRLHAPQTNGAPKKSSSLFTVKVVRAENLRPSIREGVADPYVVLSNQAGLRVAKTSTLSNTLDPKWEESFDISSQGPLWLSATIWDKDSTGDHSVSGRSFVQLDPRHFEDFLMHDIWLDLDTQGRLLLQVSMEGEKDDIQFYFGKAFRSLERAEADMIRILVGRMSTTIRQCLSRRLLRALLNSGLYNMDKAITGVTALYQSARDVARGGKVPPSPGIGTASTKGPGPQKVLTDVEVENAIGPLLDYFDLNLKTLNEHLSDEVFEALMMRVWDDVVSALEDLMVPPLSDKPSDHKALSDKEIDVVFKWLRFLRDYFHSNGDGIPLDELSTARYRDLMMFRLYYDMESEILMQECIHSMQHQLAVNRWPSMRRKLAREGSVMNHRNLGTMRRIEAQRKEEMARNPLDPVSGRGGADAVNNGEIIMRILRMRPNMAAFLRDQMRMWTYVQQQTKIGPVSKQGGLARQGRR